MTFLHNAWYVAAFSDEVADAMLARTYLEIPIVLYRHEGKLVALHDRCPHRFAPLSTGERMGDGIRCGYHGLQFNSDGRCIKNLFGPVAPRAARARRFPTHEQDGVVWIWMGELPPGNVAALPDLYFRRDPAYRTVQGHSIIAANYLLIGDNLMDLTHTATLHPAFGGLDYLPAYKCREEADAVVSQYTCETMPSFLPHNRGEPLYKRDEIRWTAPGNHMLETVIAAQADVERTAAIHVPSAHLATPQTADSTHYFWTSIVPDPTADLETARTGFAAVFDGEDKPMLEAVQRRMRGRDLWEMDPVLLPTDAGSVRMRRRMAALIAAEQGGTGAIAETTQA